MDLSALFNDGNAKKKSLLRILLSLAVGLPPLAKAEAPNSSKACIGDYLVACLSSDHALFPLINRPTDCEWTLRELVSDIPELASDTIARLLEIAEQRNAQLEAAALAQKEIQDADKHRASDELIEALFRAFPDPPQTFVAQPGSLTREHVRAASEFLRNAGISSRLRLLCRLRDSKNEQLGRALAVASQSGDLASFRVQLHDQLFGPNSIRREHAIYSLLSLCGGMNISGLETEDSHDHSFEDACRPARPFLAALLRDPSPLVRLAAYRPGMPPEDIDAGLHDSCSLVRQHAALAKENKAVPLSYQTIGLVRSVLHGSDLPECVHQAAAPLRVCFEMKYGERPFNFLTVGKCALDLLLERPGMESLRIAWAGVVIESSTKMDEYHFPSPRDIDQQERTKAASERLETEISSLRCGSGSKIDEILRPIHWYDIDVEFLSFFTRVTILSRLAEKLHGSGEEWVNQLLRVLEFGYFHGHFPEGYILDELLRTELEKQLLQARSSDLMERNAFLLKGIAQRGLPGRWRIAEKLLSLSNPESVQAAGVSLAAHTSGGLGPWITSDPITELMLSLQSFVNFEEYPNLAQPLEKLKLTPYTNRSWLEQVSRLWAGSDDERYAKLRECALTGGHFSDESVARDCQMKLVDYFRESTLAENPRRAEQFAAEIHRLLSELPAPSHLSTPTETKGKKLIAKVIAGATEEDLNQAASDLLASMTPNIARDLFFGSLRSDTDVQKVIFRLEKVRSIRSADKTFDNPPSDKVLARLFRHIFPNGDPAAGIRRYRLLLALCDVTYPLNAPDSSARARDCAEVRAHLP